MVQKERFGPIESFEEYYMIGEKRSLMKLEIKLKTAPERKGPSLRTLKSWSGKFRWQEQISERNGELRRALADESVKSITEYKTGFLKKVESVIETGFESNGKPIVSCEKARDLKDLIDVSLRLMGEEQEKELKIEFNVTRYEESGETGKKKANE
jgi:hypothetical protein